MCASYCCCRSSWTALLKCFDLFVFVIVSCFLFVISSLFVCMLPSFDLINDNLGGSDDRCPRQSRRPPPLSPGDKTTTVKKIQLWQIHSKRILSPTLSSGDKTFARNISPSSSLLLKWFYALSRYPPKRREAEAADCTWLLPKRALAWQSWRQPCRSGAGWVW